MEPQMNTDSRRWAAGFREDNARNTSAIRVPSTVMQAVLPFCRTEPIMVSVSPSTTWCGGFPRGERPRKRVILVLAADSSRKTRREGSEHPWISRQMQRARATSGRDCSEARRVFFICQPHVSPMSAPCQPHVSQNVILKCSSPPIRDDPTRKPPGLDPGGCGIE